MLVKMCNCAECGRELLGESMRSWYLGLSEADRKAQPPLTAGRVNGRPYCPTCLERPAPKPFASWRGPHEGEPSPWQENNVRHLEDG